MQLDSGQWIVIGICAVLVAGYIRGFYVNRQKAEKVTTWLKAGLQKWGKASPGASLGTLVTGGRWLVYQPPAPFQHVEALFLLEPQENLLFWLFYRLQGRQDEIILKINLKKAPAKRLEIQWPGRGRQSKQPNAASAEHFSVTPEETDITFLQPLMHRYGNALRQVIWQNEKPHIIIRIRLAAVLHESSEEFFETLYACLK